MTDYRTPALGVPQRKPLPGSNAGLQFHSSKSPSPQYPPQSMDFPQPPQQQQQARTTSSSFAPNPMHQVKPMTPINPQSHHPSQQQQQQQQQQQRHPTLSSWNPSTATSSITSTTGGNSSIGRQVSDAHANVHRSSSSGSANSHFGYVALMRKQRATVWCDRAQKEDPHLQAQRQAAKQRAMLEVQGGGSGRTSTTLSSGKIRHNAAGRPMNFNTSTMVGAAVPLRLSANEVGEANDTLDQGPPLPPGPGSERGSMTSNQIPSGPQRQPQSRLSSSSSHSPPNLDPPEKQPDIPEIVETPVEMNPDERLRLGQTSPTAILPTTGKLQLHNADETDRPVTSHTQSHASELEESFDQVSEMTAPTRTAAATAAQKRKVATDLQRRGSIDDRSSSMGGVKLFIANPDLSD